MASAVTPEVPTEAPLSGNISKKTRARCAYTFISLDWLTADGQPECHLHRRTGHHLA